MVIETLPTSDILPFLSMFSTLAIPIIGITLLEAAQIKARILVGNYSREELAELEKEAISIINEGRHKEYSELPLTFKEVEQKALATLVLTKLRSASKKLREKNKTGFKKTKRRPYM